MCALLVCFEPTIYVNVQAMNYGTLEEQGREILDLEL